MKEKILFCWSGGKDSSLALWTLLQDSRFEVVSLLTTKTAEYDRVTMHGVREILVEQQAQSLGFPLRWVTIKPSASNEEYEKQMGALLEEFKQKGVSKVAFGDIFLEDLKVYREKQLARAGMTGVFPIWKRDTRELMRTFEREGFRGVTTCVDLKKLPESFSGRELNAEFVRDLPPSVDPCGENGEFHSFVYRGPVFKKEVEYRLGARVSRDGFCFTDLEPLAEASTASFPPIKY